MYDISINIKLNTITKLHINKYNNNAELRDEFKFKTN